MRLLRNLLALVGLLALIAIGAAILAFEPYVNKARSLDEGALAVYLSAARTILATGNPAEAMVYQRRVAGGLTVSDVEHNLAQAAAQLELFPLGSLDVDRQVRERTGRSFPLQKIYLFCDPQLASELIRHDPAMGAFLPCRIVLQEDERGALWLMTPNLEPLVSGGRPLPVALQDQARDLQSQLRKIVDEAAGVAGPTDGIAPTVSIFSGKT
jgi:uncharacterized protein (DUF302 family)